MLIVGGTGLISTAITRQLLARGDASGQAIHFIPQSARYLWLDRAQRALRRR